MKKIEIILVLFILPFFSISFLNSDVNNKALAEYEVKFTYTGFTTHFGGFEHCHVNDRGQVILSGVLMGNENTGADVPVLYIGSLLLSINGMDICSAKREANGEDKFCLMTVKGSGYVNVELELDPSAGYGYIKFNYDSTDKKLLKFGKYQGSVQGTCDGLQMIEEQKMIPNETIASIFNGKELPMLNERTLKKKPYSSDKEPDGETVVEVLRKIR